MTAPTAPAPDPAVNSAARSVRWPLKPIAPGAVHAAVGVAPAFVITYAS